MSSCVPGLGKHNIAGAYIGSSHNDYSDYFNVVECLIDNKYVEYEHEYDLQVVYYDYSARHLVLDSNRLADQPHCPEHRQNKQHDVVRNQEVSEYV